MHLLLTDRLCCPRCGPDFGLILLARRMHDRRVLDGLLGCPNCRDDFPVQDGFGDLRAPPRRELDGGLVGEPPDRDLEGAGRLTALLGVPGGPGTVALVGGAARHAARIAAAVEGIEVVGVDADLARWPDAPGVSRLVGRPGLPFFSRTLRGVAVDGRLGEQWLAEAARVAAPRARVVVVHPPSGAVAALRDAGLEVRAEDAETVVAARG